MDARLETERLILRQFQESDLDAYAEICGDPEVMRYVGEFKPMDRANAWRSMATHLGHWQLRGYGMWAVEEKATGRMIGRVGLWKPEGWPDLEVGWMIHRAYWGRGLATEAGRASIDAAFRMLEVDHVISVIHPDNAASIRVAEQVGESFERDWTLHGLSLRIYGSSRPRTR
ncbi:GNAT family N-acetyltransferase [Hyalangium rubrum]|uniref:GNAT family N-acetyltransferase n=1 Tax=Hyalangium rubrum TaxID=3103134 RepID=A0ABU5HA13_9BACT|nr:GNAT family N-acetyltransferase [Hyalangium sp. s54d21]MDY7229694.1 GNAT family N-acetyltransferase [Hyalangium sp. s54d21]